VVRDWERGRPLWFGGQDRSEASRDAWFAGRGPTRCRRIRRAVMAMGNAVRNSTLQAGHAPPAGIGYAQFPSRTHLGTAMDEGRQPAYQRLSGKDRRFITGQKDHRRSRRENLTTTGRAALNL